MPYLGWKTLGILAYLIKSLLANGFELIEHRLHLCGQYVKNRNMNISRYCLQQITIDS